MSITLLNDFGGGLGKFGDSSAISLKLFLTTHGESLNSAYLGYKTEIASTSSPWSSGVGVVGSEAQFPKGTLRGKPRYKLQVGGSSPSAPPGTHVGSLEEGQALPPGNLVGVKP